MCKLGPFCGDGQVQMDSGGNEECDVGKDNGNTSLGESGCTAGCKKPRFCGDGSVDTDLGEECDLGDSNGRKLDGNLSPTTDPSGQVYCSADCTIPPGIVY